MADLGWFRNLGQRPHSPTRPAGPEHDGDLPGELRHRQSYSSMRLLGPHGPVHRVSSFLSLDLGPSSGREGRPGGATPSPTPTADSPTTTTTTTTDSTVDTDGGGGRGGGTDSAPLDEEVAAAAVVRDRDRTWQSPSLDMVVEALQVAMMTKRDALVPLPVHYNAHVLALIEGYAKLRRRVAEAREEAAELRRLMGGEREEFRAVAEEWSAREEAYRAEVRRLELVIARTSRDGMETVVLARSGSLVDRGARKGFQERLKRLSSSQDDEEENYQIEPQSQRVGIPRTRGSFKTIDHIPRTLNPDQDIKMSQRLQQEDDSTREHRRRLVQYRETRPEVTREQTPELGQRSTTYLPPGSQSSIQANTRSGQSETAFQSGRHLQYQMGIDSSPSSSSTSTESAASQPQERKAGQDTEEVTGGLGHSGEHVTSVYRTMEDADTKGRPSSPPINTVGYTVWNGFTNGNWSPGEGGETSRQGAGPEGEGYSSRAQPHMENQQVRRFSFHAGDDEILSVTPPVLLSGDQNSTAERARAAAPSTDDTSTLTARAAGLLSLVTGFVSSSERLRPAAATETATQQPTSEVGPNISSGSSGSATTTSSACYDMTPSTSTGSVIHVGNRQSTLHKDDLARSRLGVRREGSGRGGASGAGGDGGAGGWNNASSRDTVASPQPDVLASSSLRVVVVDSPSRQPARVPSRAASDAPQKLPGAAPVTTASPSQVGQGLTASGGMGGTESAGNAARIAAARAVARGNKREQDKQSRLAPGGSCTT